MISMSNFYHAGGTLVNLDSVESISCGYTGEGVYRVVFCLPSKEVSAHLNYKELEELKTLMGAKGIPFF